MVNATRKSVNLLPRWWFPLALIVLIPLVVDFNARLVILHQMRAEEAKLAQAIAAEKERHAALEATRAYVESDAYVESWARVEARMALPGEIVVIPVVPSGPPPKPGPAPISTPRPPETPLEEWWELFFGPALP